MRLFFSLLLCLCAVSFLCAQNNGHQPLIRQPNPPDNNPQYFPVGLFSRYSRLSDFRTRWYASELRGLQQPSLLEAQVRPGAAVYRFLLIPPFTPSLVISLTLNPDGSGTLLAKLGTRRSRGGETTPKQQTLSLAPAQVNKFLNLVRESNFWSLPSAQPEEGLVRFADGKEWLIEAKESGKYHVVDRSDNAMEVGFSLACDYLQELSPLKTQTGQKRRPTTEQSTSTPD
jgi:hypothetical protein